LEVDTVGDADLAFDNRNAVHLLAAMLVGQFAVPEPFGGPVEGRVDAP
jgi:hypothetical protein